MFLRIPANAGMTDAIRDSNDFEWKCGWMSYNNTDILIVLFLRLIMSITINYKELRPMKTLTRITINTEVMGGKPCIRGMRVTVGTVVGLMAAGRSPDEILKAYPYLEEADIYEALTYAAWRVEEREIDLNAV
jgi:uncharacterized protein (DUF433 family)